jgi:hypothetical protein
MKILKATRTFYHVQLKSVAVGDRDYGIHFSSIADADTFETTCERTIRSVVHKSPLPPPLNHDTFHTSASTDDVKSTGQRDNPDSPFKTLKRCSGAVFKISDKPINGLSSLGEQLETRIFYMINNTNALILGSSISHNFNIQDIWDDLVSILGIVSTI